MERLRAAVSWMATGVIAVGLAVVLVTSSQGAAPGSSGIIADSRTVPTTTVHHKAAPPRTPRSSRAGEPHAAVTNVQPSVAPSESRRATSTPVDETPAPTTTAPSATTTSTAATTAPTTAPPVDDGGWPGSTGVDY